MVKILFKIGLTLSISILLIITLSFIFIIGTPYDTLNNSKQVEASIQTANNQTIGNGIVLSKNKIITSCHITKKLTQNFKINYKGNIKSGEVIRSNKKVDLSLIKVDEPLKYKGNISFEKARNGEEIYSFSKLEEQEIKTGKIQENKEHINVQNKDYFYKTDFNLENGYSGGPVLNDEGNIIGINQGKVKRGGEHLYSIIVSSQAINDFLNEKLEINNNYNSLGGKLCNS